MFARTCQVPLPQRSVEAGADDPDLCVALAGNDTQPVCKRGHVVGMCVELGYEFRLLKRGNVVHADGVARPGQNVRLRGLGGGKRQDALDGRVVCELGDRPEWRPWNRVCGQARSSIA